MTVSELRNLLASLDDDVVLFTVFWLGDHSSPHRTALKLTSIDPNGKMHFIGDARLTERTAP